MEIWTDAVLSSPSQNTATDCRYDSSKSGHHPLVDAGANEYAIRMIAECIRCSILCLSDKMATTEALDVLHHQADLTCPGTRPSYNIRVSWGLCFFMTRAVMASGGSLTDRLQRGLDQGFDCYMDQVETAVELAPFGNLRNLYAFRKWTTEQVQNACAKKNGMPANAIVAAVWSVITTTSFDQALERAADVGADSSATIMLAGGLAGIYYGFGSFPKERWKRIIHNRG